MCIQLSKFPLFELNNGKRKVLLDYSVILENRDFTSLQDYEMDWQLAFKGLGKESLMKAIKKNDLKSFVKYVNVPCGHCEMSKS